MCFQIIQIYIYGVGRLGLHDIVSFIRTSESIIFEFNMPCGGEGSTESAADRQGCLRAHYVGRKLCLCVPRLGELYSNVHQQDRMVGVSAI